SQLREAALLTLEAQRRALEAEMWLRDASAYNVQIDGGRPILIDSLSFEVADTSAPWPAYRQFCKHFLAPLALMAHRDLRCGLMLRDFIDGMPLDLAAGLLPGRTRLGGLLPHLHLHANADRRAQNAEISGAADRPAEAGRVRSMSMTRHLALLDSLRRTVEGLRLELGSHWLSYTRQTSYSDAAAASKHEIVERMLAAAGGKVVWDLGANVGTYSDLAAGSGRQVIAFDQDPSVVELHWRNLSAEARASVLPLVMDLTNPSPALGWAHQERRSLLQRGPADVALALALVHHLVIGNNVPLSRVADLMAQVGRRVVIEFVPRPDPMVQQLLASRRDIFVDYTIEAFRDAFAERFVTLDEAPVSDSLRTLFLMERRPD
ncbi:MAG: SAM-dependent methyltransferase, partial [Candidatus Rokuibacteriota bacterium]